VPPRAGSGDWSFDDLVELDLPAIIAAVCERAGAAPAEIALLGHSLGGLVAAAAVGTGRVPAPRALVLAATSVWLRGGLGRRAIMAAYRGVTAVVGRAPIRALRVGTADESATYVEQLTGWARSGRWTSLRNVDYAAALETIATPTHAFCSAGDWMCRPPDAEAICGRIPTCGRLRIVGRVHGDALDPDHFQLFTRDELAPLWLDLADDVR
jgi:alpha-beta hydrolase superfamily lysophospholipase